LGLPYLTNAAARAHFLARQGLAASPFGRLNGDELVALIRGLGFVQVDSVLTVERAHHMILHARRFAYRPPMLKRLLERERSLFEHWTHDAAVLPCAFLPAWRERFRIESARLAARWKDWHGEGWLAEADRVLEAVIRQGPTLARTLSPGRSGRSEGWWDWHPGKTALEYLWRRGDLAITRRDGFQKVYDHAPRVLPPGRAMDHDEWVAWSCDQALDRLGFATGGEIAAFWGLVTPAEVAAWSAEALSRGAIERLTVEGADGRRRVALARTGFAEADVPSLPRLTRILSPFDPALRDRNRCEFLFGFNYRIEIFTPAAKRRYGYYVFPVLEGDRLTGRIDAAADSAGGALDVRAWWPEAGVRPTGPRRRALEAALGRTAALAGLAGLRFAGDWIRPG
jgi:hypothetical protein